MDKEERAWNILFIQNQSKYKCTGTITHSNDELEKTEKSSEYCTFKSKKNLSGKIQKKWRKEQSVGRDRQMDRQINKTYCMIFSLLFIITACYF